MYKPLLIFALLFSITFNTNVIAGELAEFEKEAINKKKEAEKKRPSVATDKFFHV